MSDKPTQFERAPLLVGMRFNWLERCRLWLEPYTFTAISLPHSTKSEGSLFALYTKHISYYLYSYSARRGLYLIEPVPN